MTRFIFALLLVLPVVVLIGCDTGAKASVKGKVSYGSKTVKFGEVVIFGGDGIPKTGKIDRNGNYEVSDVISGAGKIAVRCPHPKEVPSANREQQTVVDPVDAKNWFPISSQYADPNTSGLVLQVSAGENSYDIKMTPK